LNKEASNNELRKCVAGCREAEARASKAEEQKIELTLALARLEDDARVSSASSQGVTVSVHLLVGVFCPLVLG